MTERKTLGAPWTAEDQDYVDELKNELESFVALSVEQGKEIERLRGQVPAALTKRIAELREALQDMPCAYHDQRESDKCMCFCGDCTDLSCDCPKHEVLKEDSDE